MKLFTSGQTIADLEVSRIGQPDDIAGKRFIYDFFTLRHKRRRTAETHHLPETHVLIVRVPLEPSRANLHERDATAVIRIHIGMNLKDKSGERLFVRTNDPLDSLHRGRRRGDTYKAVQQLAHTEIIQGRAEKDRSHIAFQVRRLVEFGIDPIDQFHISPQLLGQRSIDMLFQLRAVDIFKLDTFRHRLLTRHIQIEFLFVKVIDAFETHAHLDRPA